MPNVKNKNKARKRNGKTGGRPKTKNDEISDSSDDNESDPDYFSGPQPRVDNSY